MSNKRYWILFAGIGVLTLCMVIRLCSLQIVSGAEYKEESLKRLYKTVTVQAPRGEIFDRNGQPLVTNRMGFSVRLERQKDDTDETINAVIERLLTVLKQADEWDGDSLPISTDAPYEFLFSDDEKRSQELDWKRQMELEDVSAEEVLRHYQAAFHITDDQPVRDLVGVRYDMLIRGFSTATPFTVARDVSIDTITVIKEMNRDYPNVNITTEPIREYAEGNPAVHILGRTGAIDRTEYEALQEQGYTFNDTIGKQGIEKYLEAQLRGVNGYNRVQQNSYGRYISVLGGDETQPGNNAYLTLDLDAQRAAEKALKDTVDSIRANSVDGVGADVAGASVVAVEVNTGETLVSASYPSYDPADFSKHYGDLLEDPLNPLLNRAIGGAYAPGSTFKMITAITALEEGIITPEDEINCTRIYDFYEGYQPACTGTHGEIDVRKAIEVSCNYFFFDVGRLAGIDAIDKFASMFRLGQKTGIELTEEEVPGVLDSVEYKKNNKPEPDNVWYPGDTLQVSIGQGNNMFTPIQLACYTAAIANGGNLVQPHLVKSIRSYNERELIEEVAPTFAGTVDVAPETLQIVQEGMRQVALEGSVSEYFKEYEIAVAAKTGTSQLGNGKSNNGIFVAYAPYDNPQIAVAVVIEHAGSGSACAPVAKAVIDAYLNSAGEPDTITEKNVLQ